MSVRFHQEGGPHFESNPAIHRITPTHATGSCLDVSGVSTADGAVVQLWQWLNGANQQWAPQPRDIAGSRTLAAPLLPPEVIDLRLERGGVGTVGRP
jgi:hypothetical protein